MKKISLYYHTIKYLKKEQISARLRRKLPSGKRKESDIPGPVWIPKLYIQFLDADPDYLKRFDVDRLMGNEVFLLNETHVLNPEEWKVEGNTTHLWRFNLHYLEYLIPLAIRYASTGDKIYYQKIKELFRAWHTHAQAAEGDAWEAYTISLRIPVLLIVMNLLEEELKEDEEFYQLLCVSIGRQYQFLKNHTEKHLLGNHYLENLKCLLICSMMFGEKKEAAEYKSRFRDQIREQILPDGMHFERSFMYHKIVMEDLLRVILLLRQSGGEDEMLSFCTQMFRKMCDVEAGFEAGLCRTLLFNDAGDNVAKPTEALLLAGKKLGLYQESGTMRLELPEAGYYKYRISNMQLILDCGRIGPDYIPGHGHCDCLSYELFREGRPLIVNSGTFQYQDEKRGYFRSTKAHNTFTIDGREQSQCWGEHRVAKRVHGIFAVKERERFRGTCTFWSGDRAERIVELTENGMTVTDRSIASKAASIQSYIHFAPQIKAEKADEKNYVLYGYDGKKAGYVEVIKGSAVRLDRKDSYYSEEFGKCESIDAMYIASHGGSEIKYCIIWRNKQDD